MPTPVWCFECEQAWSACWCRKYGKEPVPLYEMATEEHDCLADPRVVELVRRIHAWERNRYSELREWGDQLLDAVRAIEGKHDA